MSNTVQFIHMADGSREDYKLLQRLEAEYVSGLVPRLLVALGRLKDSYSGYQVSRLEHCLQGATRAQRAGEDDDTVVAVLLHDIGDELAPYTHGELAASILRPFVSARLYWVVKHHGLFQMVYYAHHYGMDGNARERFKDHPYYQATVDFCEKYDQNCFDPNYDSLPLGDFEPVLNRVFSRTPHFSESEAL